MLPDAENPPAGAAEGAGDKGVAGLVAGDLLAPELRVGLGLRGVDRTPVPKTPVHKHRQLELGKNKVGFAEDRRLPPPTGDAVLLEYRHQPQLGGLVAGSSDAGHDRRPLLTRKNIGHGSHLHRFNRFIEVFDIF